MKTIQNHILGLHTFPMNVQADVSSLHGGSQAGAALGLCVDVCDRDEHYVRSGL